MPPILSNLCACARMCIHTGTIYGYALHGCPVAFLRGCPHACCNRDEGLKRNRESGAGPCRAGTSVTWPSVMKVHLEGSAAAAGKQCLKDRPGVTPRMTLQGLGICHKMEQGIEGVSPGEPGYIQPVKTEKTVCRRHHVKTTGLIGFLRCPCPFISIPALPA